MPYLALSFTTEVLDELRRSLYLRHLKLLFPRRGKQCPVVEFSYMGYSSPKCLCNGNHTNIQVNCAYPYLNVYMPHPMPQVLVDFLTHAISMYEKLFSKQRYFFYFWKTSYIYISGYTPINNYVDNPPIYCSGHTPLNNYWSTLRNYVMHLHLLFYGFPKHMKCNILFSCQYISIYQACIY